MKKEKQEKTTFTVRLTNEEDQVLRRICMLKKTSNTGYLARLAKDFPAIMDEIARTKKGDKRTVEAFLSAVETLSKVKEDPELYNLAVKASANKHGLVDGNLLRGLKIL